MPPHLTLYGYAKSSCSARVRIALALKGLPHATVSVDFVGKEQRGAAYAAVNPSLSIPTLAVRESGDASQKEASFNITQSVAALEYLEEAFPGHPVPLLPASPAERARIRALTEIMATDLQPRTSNPVLEALGREFRLDQAAQDRWAHDWCVREFTAYEKLLQQAAGGGKAKYSAGDAVSLADCCLVPAVWNAVERWGVDLAKFPALACVYENLMALPAVAGAHWRLQPDAPKE